MLGNILLRKLTRYSRNNTSIRNRSNRIWSRVWSGARDGSRLLLDQLHSLGFSISYDKASLFEQSVLHKEILLLITVNTAQTMLIPTLTSPMNPTHFTEWVLSADQRPNQYAKNRNPDSTAGQDYDLWSRRSKRDHNGSACSISHVISILLGISVEINMYDTENTLTDVGLDELVWLYIGCFPFGLQCLI